MPSVPHLPAPACCRASDRSRLRELLTGYTRQRILFYEARRQRQAERISAATARLEADVWSAIQSPALAQPTPITALVVSE